MLFYVILELKGMRENVNISDTGKSLIGVKYKMKTDIYCIQLQIFMEQNKSQNAIFLRDQLTVQKCLFNIKNVKFCCKWL